MQITLNIAVIVLYAFGVGAFNNADFMQSLRYIRNKLEVETHSFIGCVLINDSTSLHTFH